MRAGLQEGTFVATHLLFVERVVLNQFPLRSRAAIASAGIQKYMKDHIVSEAGAGAGGDEEDDGAAAEGGQEEDR